MRFDLSAEAEDEASIGLFGKVPGQLCRNHWATSKGNVNGRTQTDTACVSGSESHRQAWIVGCFGGPEAIEAKGFNSLSQIGNKFEAFRMDSGIKFHGSGFR